MKDCALRSVFKARFFSIETNRGRDFAVLGVYDLIHGFHKDKYPKNGRKSHPKTSGYGNGGKLPVFSTGLSIRFQHSKCLCRKAKTGLSTVSSPLLQLLLY